MRVEVVHSDTQPQQVVDHRRHWNIELGHHFLGVPVYVLQFFTLVGAGDYGVGFFQQETAQFADLQRQ